MVILQEQIFVPVNSYLIASNYKQLHKQERKQKNMGELKTGKPWGNNMCTIYAYKSSRKNAKIISNVTMRHLITHDQNECLSEERILNYFVGIIGQLAMDIKFFSNVICITTYSSIDRITTYVDANSHLYSHLHTMRLNNNRVKFSSFEQLINYLYDILLLVYPYTRLDLNTIYSNSSIKYFINLYYHG